MTEPLAQVKAAPDMSRSIVLVGLMGAGKTAVGRRLAALLNINFVDADAEIEKAAGCSINDFFEIYGEQAFREGEQKVMERLLTGTPAVIAAGGGAFIAPNTRARIKEHGVSVWLKANLDILVERTTGRTHRPLLNQGNPAEILQKLMDERYPVYAEADVTVETGEGSAAQMSEKVLAALKEFWAETEGAARS